VDARASLLVRECGVHTVRVRHAPTLRDQAVREQVEDHLPQLDLPTGRFEVMLAAGVDEHEANVVGHVIAVHQFVDPLDLLLGEGVRVNPGDVGKVVHETAVRPRCGYHSRDLLDGPQSRRLRSGPSIVRSIRVSRWTVLAEKRAGPSRDISRNLGPYQLFWHPFSPEQLTA
jgi:hypothetical protein